jgi:hypothetical protein
MNLVCAKFENESFWFGRVFLRFCGQRLFSVLSCSLCGGAVTRTQQHRGAPAPCVRAGLVPCPRAALQLLLAPVAVCLLSRAVFPVQSRAVRLCVLVLLQEPNSRGSQSSSAAWSISDPISLWSLSLLSVRRSLFPVFVLGPCTEQGAPVPCGLRLCLVHLKSALCKKKKRFLITSNLRYIHGVLNIDKIKN